MADKKISALTAVTTPLAGTEVLPIVQSSTTKKVASDDLTVKNVRSNATTGILQIAGPAAGATRTMTTPDANFTVARTDAAQTFTGQQTFSSDARVNSLTVGRGAGTGINNVALGTNALNNATDGSYNTSIGDFAFGTANRSNGVAIGFQTGYASSGSQGTYVGTYAGFNTTGTNNYFFGFNAGKDVTSGAYNVIIGSYTGSAAPISATGNNYVVISDGGANIKAYGDGSNNWVLPTGNLVIGTAGKGIDFSANTNAAGMTSELLADYEEGTWTPVIAGSVTPGTYDLASSLATYTKIGRQVTVSALITTASSFAGGGTGDFIITGLPFSKSANQRAFAAVAIGGMNYTAGGVVFASFGTSGESATLYFTLSVSNTGATLLPISLVGASNFIGFTLSYNA